MSGVFFYLFFFIFTLQYYIGFAIHLVLYVIILNLSFTLIGTSLMAQSVKNPLAEQETEKTRVWSLGREDPLEKEMATYSSVLAWRMPGTGETGGLPSMGSHRVRHGWSDLAAAAAAEYIMRNAGLEEAQAGIKIAGRNVSHLRYADDTTLLRRKSKKN